MSLGDKDIWEHALNQDRYIFQEFGLAIIGIGALFVAYGSIHDFFLEQIIALIGITGGFTLWMHIFGSRKEIEAIKEVLKKNNSGFVEQFHNIQAWRNNRWYRLSYYPVTRIMTYFLSLLTWAWVAIFLKPYIPLPEIKFLSIIVLMVVIVMAVCRKIQDIKKYNPHYSDQQSNNKKIINTKITDLKNPYNPIPLMIASIIASGIGFMLLGIWVGDQIPHNEWLLVGGSIAYIVMTISIVLILSDVTRKQSSFDAGSIPPNSTL